MLHAPETKVEKARYPGDRHSHAPVDRAKDVNGVGMGEKMDSRNARSAAPVMDRRNIKILVNMTGGSGKGLENHSALRPNAPDRLSSSVANDVSSDPGALSKR